MVTSGLPTKIPKRIGKLANHRIYAVATALTLSGTAIADGFLNGKNDQIRNANCDLIIARGSLMPTNPISCQRLKSVEFSHLGFDQTTKNGTLVVLDTIAPLVKQLMSKLNELGHHIEKAVPISSYHGDDNLSMADNNTSAFNGRKTTGNTTWSLHAYGAAIDINPIQNPFISLSEDGTAQIKPKASTRYAVNRSNYRPNKHARIGMAENVVELFASHGFFVWGGDWDYPIDYQHFQIGPRRFVEKLASLDAADGRELLQTHIQFYKNCRSKSQNPAPQARKTCIELVINKMSK